MEVTSSRSGGFSVVAVDGEIDPKASVDLERALSDLVTEGERRFVIDLAGVERLSGAGVRVLLMFARKLSGLGGHLALCSLASPVQAIFDVAGFANAFTICASRGEAIAQAPSGVWRFAAIEKAAAVLGVSRSGVFAASRPGPGNADLAARAARLLVGTADGAPGGAGLAAGPSPLRTS
jgi:anti-anti-sigma factor